MSTKRCTSPERGHTHEHINVKTIYTVYLNRIMTEDISNTLNLDALIGCEL